MATDVLSLIIFGFCIIMFVWDKLPMATSAILGCALMVVFGVCDFKTAFGQFASSTVIMLIGVLVVGMAIAESGMARKIGRLLTHFSRGSERTLLVISYLLAAVLSTFMTNATVLAIFIPLIFSISVNNNRINPLNLVIPITLASNMGGISTLVGSSQQMTTQGLLQENGMGFKVFDFLPLGGILVVLGLLYCLFIGYPLGKKIWGSRDIKEYDVKEEETKDDPFKLVAISVIFLGMVACYVLEVFPVAVTSTLAALLCIITGCVSQKKAIAGINWNIIGRLAGCLGIAKALDAAGGITLIYNALSGWLVGGVSPFALFAILVAFTQVVSLVISNSTAILVTMPIVIAIAGTMNLNVMAFGLGITMAASFGMCCPLSGSTWGISMSAGYKFRDYFKYGVLFDVLGCVTVLIFIPLVYGLTV